MRRSSENLHRNNLSKREEGQEVLKYLELRFAKEGGQVAQPMTKASARRQRSLASHGARSSVLIEAGAIKPKAAYALQKAGLDNNGEVLSQVARVKPDKQATRVEQIVRERVRKPVKGKGGGQKVRQSNRM